MKHGSLFSGIGGFDLAAEWMGWKNVFHCEINSFGQRILKQNWPKAIQYHDITKTDFSIHRGNIDILTGGFPCQDISYAKSWTTNDSFSVNGIAGKRSGLWSEYAKAIIEIKPTFIVIENVAALSNQGLDIVIQSLSDIGYDAEWQIIPASFVGAPHLRKRIWIVAYPQCIGRNEESLIFSKITKQTIRQTPQWESSRTICKTNGKKTLPGNFGIYDGLPKGLYHAERITALGNAIVPQVALEIFKAINKTLEV
jgi:DNA (cytosine-5)-methyltransferase 1